MNFLVTRSFSSRRENKRYAILVKKCFSPNAWGKELLEWKSVGGGFHCIQGFACGSNILSLCLQIVEHLQFITPMINIYICFIRSCLCTSMSYVWQKLQTSSEGCKNDTIADSSGQLGRAAFNIWMSSGTEHANLITSRLWHRTQKKVGNSNWRLMQHNFKCQLGLHMCWFFPISITTWMLLKMFLFKFSF